jgi:hypothetical protein
MATIRAGGLNPPTGAWMNSTLKGAIIGAVAALLAAGVSAYPAYEQYRLAEEQARQAEAEKQRAQRQVEHYRQTFQNAAVQYTRGLGSLIIKAEEGDVVTNAKALVASRNDLRSSLESIGSRLDTEIDALEAELKKPNPNPAKVKQLLEIIKQKWPLKEQQIEVEVRKMLAEMGLTLEDSPAPPSGLSSTVN